MVLAELFYVVLGYRSLAKQDFLLTRLGGAISPLAGNYGQRIF
jgi:hypothetical protein